MNKSNLLAIKENPKLHYNSDKRTAQDLNGLVFSVPNYFHAFDTETIEGRAVVLGTEKEYKKVDSWNDILHFFNQPKYRWGIFFNYNLDYDIRAIFKHLLEESEDWTEIVKEIYHENKLKFQWNGYIVELFYIPQKLLSITYKDPEDKDNTNILRFYDTAQFYQYHGLDKDATEYFGMHKNDPARWVDVARSVGLWFRKIWEKKKNNLITEEEFNRQEKIIREYQYDYLDKHLAQIGEYCQLDCFLTWLLAGRMKKCFEMASIPFKKPLSGAALAQEYILNSGVEYPRLSMLKKTDFYANLSTFIEEAYHGGMFLLKKRGNIKKEIWNYDINSAYPDKMRNLPNWFTGQFIQVETPTDTTPYGWYLCEFDCEWIPLKGDKPYEFELTFDGIKQVFKTKNTKIYYPKGKRCQIITKVEYDFLVRHNYEVKTYMGYEWHEFEKKVEGKDYRSPFFWIEPTYEARKKIKSKDPKDPRQYSLKILMSSAYGKTCQRIKGRDGKLTNFAYASYITAPVRIQIAEFCLRHKDQVVEIATDGIYFEGPIEDNEIEIGNELGQWELTKYEGGGIFIGGGVRVLFKDKNRRKSRTDLHGQSSYTGPRQLRHFTKWNLSTKLAPKVKPYRFRGNIHTICLTQLRARGFHGNPEYDLVGLSLKPNIEKEKITFSKIRPMTLGECLIREKTMGLKFLNVFVKVDRDMKVNMDDKSIWPRPWLNFKDMMESEPQTSTPLNLKDRDFNIKEIFAEYWT